MITQNKTMIVATGNSWSPQALTPLPTVRPKIDGALKKSKKEKMSATSAPAAMRISPGVSFRLSWVA